MNISKTRTSAIFVENQEPSSILMHLHPSGQNWYMSKSPAKQLADSNSPTIFICLNQSLRIKYFTRGNL